MSLRPAILQQLTDSPNLAVEQIIELALNGASPVEQKELAEVLLQRNHRAGWVSLIRVFDRLDADIRQKLLSRPRDLFGPLSETMQDVEGPARENVINIVRLCADGKLIYLLAEALMDARTEVRDLAGNSLLETLRKYQHKSIPPSTTPTDDSELPPFDPELNNQLARAIDFIMRNYRKHRQHSALLGALLQERRQDSPFWAFFHDTFDEATRAATAIFRSPTDPALAAAIFLALGSPLKSAAMAGLASVDLPSLVQELAAESYRLLDPVLRDGSQSIGHMKIFASPDRAVPWTETTWPQWLRLVEAMGFEPQLRLSWLSRLLDTALTGPTGIVWKLTVMQAIVNTGVVEAGAYLTSMVSDTELQVARCAARHLLSKRHPEWRALAASTLPQSPHPYVRRLAVPFPRRSGLPVILPLNAKPVIIEKSFLQVWEEYPKLPPAVQVKDTRGSVADPVAAEQLRVKLSSTDVTDLVQALKMLNTLSNLTPYRGQIIGLCGHPDSRIASVAVKLIGRLEDPRLKDLLEAAAHHSDSRVRANAVESMETLHIADRSQQVLSMLHSRNNRERANAIKAISQFDFSTARECLSRMLTDPNPLHRISALWVVGQLEMLEIVRQVSSIARRDPNLRVRKRAAEMLEIIIGNVPEHTQSKQH